MRVFDAYASYYDLLYVDKDYRREVEFVSQQISRYAPKAHRVLDLGCGTGVHAALLTEKGFDVSGIDVSETMLARAGRRCDTLPQALRSNLRFSRGDVRSYRSPEPFDAITSLFHVFSYQRSNEDLLKATETLRANLGDLGIVIFDFWYGPAVLTQRPETRVKELEDDSVRVTRVARPILRENENIVEVNYSVIVEDKQTRQVERISESHVMRYLFLPEIDMLLECSGLRRLTCSNWLTDEDLSVDTWSGFVVAQRISSGRAAAKLAE